VIICHLILIVHPILRQRICYVVSAVCYALQSCFNKYNCYTRYLCLSLLLCLVLLKYFMCFFMKMSFEVGYLVGCRARCRHAEWFDAEAGLKFTTWVHCWSVLLLFTGFFFYWCENGDVLTLTLNALQCDDADWAFTPIQVCNNVMSMMHVFSHIMCLYKCPVTPCFLILFFLIILLFFFEDYVCRL